MIAIVEAVDVVLVVAEDVTTVLETHDQDPKVEDLGVTTAHLGDLRGVHQILNRKVVTIFREHEKAAENKQLC